MMRSAEVEGNLVDVVSGTIYPSRLSIVDGLVADVRKLTGDRDKYILPGLIDAHIHIESSLLSPTRFAQAVVAHGTTAVVSDPHEIANVLGMEGIRYMLQEVERAPLRIYLTAPSCVPAVPGQDFGARLGWKEVREMLSSDRFVALGEVMDFKEVLRDNPEIMAKIEVARMLGKPIDGHAPGLRGKSLGIYVQAGIVSDHECTTVEEAEEKHRQGMTIMVREGSASRDMHALMSFARRNEFLLVTDDMDAADLVKGHLDRLLSKAVGEGMDPMHAVRAATLWPAKHYRLMGGAIVEGGVADLTVVRDLTRFEVMGTWISGDRVAEQRKASFSIPPSKPGVAILAQKVMAEDLVIEHPGPVAQVSYQEALPDKIIGGEGTIDMEVVNGEVQPSVIEGILLLAVVNRYVRRKPILGLVKGFALKSGAIASSVAHDAHNLIGVGTGKEELAAALNLVIFEGGGYAACAGESSCTLPLPIAGLMSDLPCELVAAMDEGIRRFVADMGCKLPAPFMTLSFQDPSFRRAVMVDGLNNIEGA
jgi:adenine deaminase